MEKRGIIMRIMVLPAILLALAACSSETDLEPHGSAAALIGEEGGTVTGFDGQVVLTIPAGAISKATQFTLSEIRKQQSSGLVTGELFRAFIIEPYISFKVPASITLKSRGDLSAGSELSNVMAVSLYVWDTSQDYLYQCQPCISDCCVDLSTECITGCIITTGVISIMAEMGQN